jgi:hypothetical protein
LKRTRSNAQVRQSLRGRIRIALWLAIDYNSARALNLLAEIRPAVSRRDPEIVALYFHAFAIACIKARRLTEGFKAFETALGAARVYRDAALCGKILNNYGTPAAQAGSVHIAVARLEEALECHRTLGSSVSLGLVSLAEAFFAAGELARAAALIHEFHAIGEGRTTTMQGDDPTSLLAVAAVGIPLGMLLPDDTLLKLSSDPHLVDIAFTRREQYLVGPLVEAFCLLYEHADDRNAHDALLGRALDATSSLDNSLPLAIRAARLGSGHYLARIATLTSRECPKTSALLRAHKDLFDSFIAGRRTDAHAFVVCAYAAASCLRRPASSAGCGSLLKRQLRSPPNHQRCIDVGVVTITTPNTTKAPSSAALARNVPAARALLRRESCRYLDHRARSFLRFRHD